MSTTPPRTRPRSCLTQQRVLAQDRAGLFSSQRAVAPVPHLVESIGRVADGDSITHIHAQGFGHRAAACQRIRGGLRCCLVDVDVEHRHGDVRTRELMCHGRAKARTSAGDGGGASGELRHVGQRTTRSLACSRSRCRRRRPATLGGARDRSRAAEHLRASLRPSPCACRDRGSAITRGSHLPTKHT